MKRMICVLMVVLSLPLTALSVKRVYYEEPDTTYVPKNMNYDHGKLYKYEFKEYVFRNPKDTISSELIDIMNTMAKQAWFKTYKISFEDVDDYTLITITDIYMWHEVNIASLRRDFYGIYQIKTNVGLRKFIIYNKGGDKTKAIINAMFKPTNRLLCYRRKLTVIEDDFCTDDRMAFYRGAIANDELIPIKYYIIDNIIYPPKKPEKKKEEYVPFIFRLGPYMNGENDLLRLMDIFKKK